MKNRFPFRLLLALLIILASAAVIYIIQRNFDIKFTNPFVKNEKTAASTIILKQVRDISRLNTIEFIYKSVFPYDLIDPDTDFRALTSRYRAGEKLSFHEIEMLSVFGISAQAGIDLLKADHSFAIITTRLKAGYDFPETLPADSVKVNPQNNTIEIKLPPVKITEVIIEDADSSDYDYPDLKISPEQWKTLTSILSKIVTDEAEERGILAEADERGREFFTRILLGSGFSEVVFSDYIKPSEAE